MLLAAQTYGGLMLVAVSLVTAIVLIVSSGLNEFNELRDSEPSPKRLTDKRRQQLWVATWAIATVGFFLLSNAAFTLNNLFMGVILIGMGAVCAWGTGTTFVKLRELAPLETKKKPLEWDPANAPESDPEFLKTLGNPKKEE
jgi:hypothetical protein